MSFFHMIMRFFSFFGEEIPASARQQGKVGVNKVITTWFPNSLETKRFYTETERLLTVAPAILILAGGYFLSGMLVPDRNRRRQ
jgi:hypothetical protein